MTEREAVVVSNFKYPDDYLGRAKLLEETGLFNPVRDTPSRVQETINKRPNAIKVAKRLGSDAVIGTVLVWSRRWRLTLNGETRESARLC